MARPELTILIALALLPGLLAPASAEELLRLDLAPSVSVASASYFVEDIVSSHSGREDFWEAIRLERLGTLGASEELIDSQRVLGLLAARGYDWRLIKLGGAGSVRISRPANSVSAQSIRALLEEECSAQLGCPVEVVENDTHPLEDQSFGPGSLSMALRWPQDSRSCLPDAVQFQLDGRLERILLLRPDVEFRLPVLLAGQDIPRDTVIDSSSLESETRSIRAGSPVCADASRVVGQQVKRLMARGSLIDPTQCMLPWQVQRNDIIRLVTTGSAISSSAEGKAMENGRIGDRISVRRTDDGQAFMGTITSEGTVELE